MSKLTEAEKKFNGVKRDAKVAAMQLGYPKSILDRISACKTEAELDRVMVDARHEYL